MSSPQAPPSRLGPRVRTALRLVAECVLAALLVAGVVEMRRQYVPSFPDEVWVSTVTEAPAALEFPPAPARLLPDVCLSADAETAIPGVAILVRSGYWTPRSLGLTLDGRRTLQVTGAARPVPSLRTVGYYLDPAGPPPRVRGSRVWLRMRRAPAVPR